jgi:hypothetical protein
VRQQQKDEGSIITARESRCLYSEFTHADEEFASSIIRLSIHPVVCVPLASSLIGQAEAHLGRRGYPAPDVYCTCCVASRERSVCNCECVILSDLDPKFLLSDVFFHHLHKFAGVCNPFCWYVSGSLRGRHVKSVRAVRNRL